MNASKSIKFFQEEKNITSTELAKALGTIPQQMNRYRSQEDIKLSTALKLCDIFEITIQEFIDRS